MSMQQGFTTFKYMKKWFGEILKNIEQPWTPNWKKMQFLKHSPLPWNDNSILREGACSWTPQYPTPKPINLDNLPITQKSKCSLCALYFYLSYWAAFQLVEATWSPNRRWPDSVASIQVTLQHWRKTSWHPMHHLYNLQVTIYLHSLSCCSPI